MIKLEPRDLMSPSQGMTSPTMQPVKTDPYPPWLAQYDKEINSILHGDMEATALSSLPGTSNYQNMPYKMDASLQYTSLGSQSKAVSGPSANMGLPHLSRGLQNVTGVPTNMVDPSPTMPGVSPATPGRSPNMPEMMPSVTTVSANVTGTPLNFPSMVDMANYQLNSLLNMTNAQCAGSNTQALPTQTHYSNDLPNLEDLQATIFEEQCSMSGLLLERADLNSGDLMSLLAERNNDSMKDLKL